MKEHGEPLVTSMSRLVSKHVPAFPETNHELLYQPLGLPKDILPVQHNVQDIDYFFLDAILLSDKKVCGSNLSSLPVSSLFPPPLAKWSRERSRERHHKLTIHDISKQVELNMHNSEKGMFRKFTDAFMSGSSSEVRRLSILNDTTGSDCRRMTCR